MSAESHVVVHGDAKGFLQKVTSGTHQFQVDEPSSVGGTNAAPDPYDYLMAALGACTSMTVGYYARRKEYPLETITVWLRHSRIHARDCEECMTKEGMLDRIDVDIELTGSLSSDQRAELMKAANNCPVHKTLTHEINIRLREAGPNQ
jgi:putative redox protein